MSAVRDPGQNNAATRTRAEIPLPLVRANQWTLVITVAAAAAARQPALLLVPWTITMAGLAGGPRWQPVFRVARRTLTREHLASAPREDAAMQRFNAIMAGAFLSLALVAFFMLRVPLLTWGFAGAVALAAFVATRGFCIGCALYGYLPAAVKRMLAAGSGTLIG